MPPPLVQELKSAFNDEGVRAHIQALKEIRDLEREINRLGRERGRTSGGGASGSPGSPAAPRVPRETTQAMRDLRETTALARIEFDKLNLANRRGEISNEKFQSSVQELRRRVTRDIVAVRERFEELPRAVEVQYGRSMVALDRFATRAQEVATGQTRLRTRITQGVQDALYRVPGGQYLVGAGVGGGAMAAGAVGLAGAAGMAKAAAMAISYEKALTEVRKTTGLTAEGTERLGEDLLDVSARLGQNEQDLAAIAAQAGQLGITGTQNIVAFTETVAKFSAVSEMAAEESAAALGKVGVAFNIPVQESERLGSVINELSNTTAASSRDIVDALVRVGPAGKVIGLTADEVAGLAATLIEAGIGSERAGTQIRNILTIVQTEADQVARTMGVTREQFDRMISQDAYGTLVKYFEALQKLPPALRTVQVDEVFGKENLTGVLEFAAATVDAANGTDRLARNVHTANLAWKDGTSLNKEYAASLDTVSGQWGIFTQNIRSAATSFGGSFTPAIKEGLRAINDLFGGVEQAATEVERLRQALDMQDEAARLIDEYEQLANKTGRTADENKRLQEVLDELAAKYPQYTVYDELGKAVGVYADAIRGAIEAQREFNRVLLGEQLAEIGDTYSRLVRQEALIQDAIKQQEDRLQLVPPGDPQRRTLEVGLDASRQALSKLQTELAKTNRQAGRLFDPATVDAQTLQDELEITEEEANRLVNALRQIAKTRQNAGGGTDPGANPNGGGAGAPDPDTLRKAQEALQKIDEAQAVAAEMSDDSKAALQEVFRLQEQIASLKEIEAKLGADAVREQKAAAEEALRKARERLATERELTEKIKEAAAALGKIDPRGLDSVLGAGTWGARDRRISDLISTDADGNRTVVSGALRDAGITEEEARRLEEIVKRLDKAALSGSELAEAFQNIGSSLRSVTRLVDIFGDLPEHTRRFVDGLADSVDNAGRLLEQIDAVKAGTASLGDLLVPGIGTVAGVATAMFGFAQSYNESLRREREAAERLAKEQRQALRDNTRALRDLRDGLFAGDVVGPDIPAGTAQQAGSLADQVLKWIAGFDVIRGLKDDETRLAKWMEIVENAGGLLQQIDALGIEGFDNLYERFLELRETLGSEEALRALVEGEDGIAALLELLSNQVGTFTDTVGGLIAELQIRKDQLGQSLAELAEVLLGELADLEIDDEIKDFITDALAGISLDTPEGQEALSALLTELRKVLVGDSSMFSLEGLGLTSFEELEDLIAALELLAEGGASGSSGQTQSAVFQRQITEITASSMDLHLEHISFHAEMATRLLGQIAEYVRGIRNVVEGRVNERALPGPIFTGPPPAVSAAIARITAPRRVPAIPEALGGRSVLVDVGGVQVVRARPNERLTEEEIDQILLAIEREIRRTNWSAS